MKITKCCATCWSWFNNTLDFLRPLGDLLIRLWVADAFWQSGKTKIMSWDSTVFLFKYEYHVPWIPPLVAAVSGTAVELIMPVLIVLGLGGRLPALILFVFNIIAVVSYPYLLTEAGAGGLFHHIAWGMVLMFLMFHGTGKLSLDCLLCKWMCKKKQKAES